MGIDGETLTTVIAAIGAGGVSSLGTIAALRVHITYLKKAFEDLDGRVSKVEMAAQRAHGRIDLLQLQLEYKNDKKD